MKSEKREKMKINMERIETRAQIVLDRTKRISKSAGNNIHKAGRKCLNFVEKHPELISIITLVSISLLTNKNALNQKWTNDLENTERIQTSDDSTFSELLQEEQAINHIYPDERKSPCVHLYHLGENTFVRGGTEIEKEEFRKENNL